MLTGAKWIVESNIILGNNVISSGKNKKPKEDKPPSTTGDGDCEYGEGHPGETPPASGGGIVDREGNTGTTGGDEGEETIEKAPCQERGEDSGIPAPEGEDEQFDYSAIYD